MKKSVLSSLSRVGGLAQGPQAPWVGEGNLVGWLQVSKLNPLLTRGPLMKRCLQIIREQIRERRRKKSTQAPDRILIFWGGMSQAAGQGVLQLRPCLHSQAGRGWGGLLQEP